MPTPGVKFLGLDLKDFYLDTPMLRPEFLRMKLDFFPEDVIIEYNLREKVDEKGFVILRVKKGMYGLPYAGSSALSETNSSRILNIQTHYQPLYETSCEGSS